MQEKLSTVLLIIILALLVLSVALTKSEKEKTLEKFYQITTKDPIFFDYTLDTEKFNGVLTELKSKEKEFLREHHKYLSESDKEIFGRDWRLFPIEFLEKLTEVSKETSSFLGNPSFLKAFLLIDSQKKTLASYRTAVKAQLEVINLLFQRAPWYQNRKIRFLGSATTLGIVKQDFELMLENAVELEKEIEKREKCLMKGECDITLRITNKTRITNYGLRMPEDIGLLPLDILAPFEDYASVGGPYFVETGCFGFNEDGSPKIQPFYLFEKEGRISPKLANQNYYLDLEYMRGRWPLADIFLKKGVSYDFQPETADYRCPDLTYWASLFDGKFEVLHHFTPLSAKFLEFLILEQEIQKKPADKLYLLSARAGYSIFYLPFSPSTWRIEKKPQFLLAKPSPLPKGFETYQGLKEKGYQDQDIKGFNIRQIEVLKGGNL